MTELLTVAQEGDHLLRGVVPSVPRVPPGPFSMP
jgi:hypothetical protein